MDVADLFDSVVMPPGVAWPKDIKSDPIGDILAWVDAVNRMHKAEKIADDVVFDLVAKGMP